MTGLKHQSRFGATASFQKLEGITMKRNLLKVACGSALMAMAAGAQAVTPFQTDVATSIDRGLTWLANNAAYGPSPASCGGDSENSRARGLAVLALLEKRPSGNPADPPQGYTGANATDQSRMRNAVACMLDLVNSTSFYAYRDGNYLMALSLYLRSGGPDKAALVTSGEIPAASQANYDDLITAINRLVDRTLTTQARVANGYAESGYDVQNRAHPYFGMWGYTGAGGDSSTTQFAVAGLASAKSVYSDATWGDPGNRLNGVANDGIGGINGALTRARQHYTQWGSTAGSDNGSCDRIEENEAGHGYYYNYNPSLQQTASGTWVQVMGGATVNDASVQAYLRWLRNHYRHTDLDSMGNSWPSYSYWYYLWSSFKAMELIKASGIAPAPGNIGPDDMGMLAATTDPNPADALAGTCFSGATEYRQLHLDPDALPRVASFGAGGNGFYGDDEKDQYFDYAYKILGYQCYDGSAPIAGTDGRYGCNSAPSNWNTISSQAYALLVLQRATGGACVDSDGDGVCDEDDNCVTTPNPNQEDKDGDGVGDACDNCASTANPNQADQNQNGIGDACEGKCDVDKDGDIDKVDLAAISKNRGKPAASLDQAFDANGDNLITPADVKACIPQCTRANCATQ